MFCIFSIVSPIEKTFVNNFRELVTGVMKISASQMSKISVTVLKTMWNYSMRVTMAIFLLNSLWNWHCLIYISLKGKTKWEIASTIPPKICIICSLSSVPELLIKLWGNSFNSSTIKTKASIVGNILIFLRYHKEENKSDDIRKGGITSCKY